MDKIKNLKEQNIDLVGRLRDLWRAAEDLEADTDSLVSALVQLEQWMQEFPAVDL